VVHISYQVTSNSDQCFRGFVRTDKQTHRQTDAAITIRARSIAGAQLKILDTKFHPEVCQEHPLEAFLFSRSRPIHNVHRTACCDRWSLNVVCLSVCSSLMRLRCAKTAKRIELLFRMNTFGDPSNTAWRSRFFTATGRWSGGIVPIIKCSNNARIRCGLCLITLVFYFTFIRLSCYLRTSHVGQLGIVFGSVCVSVCPHEVSKTTGRISM